jgi:uncharacterized protein (DUF697 family)
MHDIDRTQLDFHQPAGPFQSRGLGAHHFGGGPLSEQEEIELAHELLAVNNEQELEQFLGDFLSKAVSTVGNIVRSPIGQAVGGVLKGVAQKALPMAGSALGGWIGGPLGAKIGSGLANAAGHALGLEMEFGGEGEQEFEGARQFVRLAADTAHNAVAAAQSGVDPHKAAQSAAIAAAHRLAPGLLSGDMGSASAGPLSQEGQGHSGQWKRHGRHIVLYGI